MRRCSLRLAIAITMLLGLPVPAAQASANPLHARVDALFSEWNNRTTPGCVVGIARDGVLDYARGYGMANLEHGIPLTPESVVHTASMSKQFTAFAIGLLAQDGKLKLTDDIRTWLPQLPDLGHVITIAQLVHHLDGLREQGQILNLAGWRGDDLYTEDDILWALARQRHLNFEPGTEIVYGNAAYTLLAVIVRKVSGQSLRAFADARIFQPLGMRATRFRDDHTETTPGRASGYSPRPGGGWAIGIPNIDHYGSTGLLSTVGDLLAWQRNLVDHRVGGPALGAWMRTSGVLPDGAATGYGGGVRIGTYRGLRTVGHDGADGGYRSEMLLFPDQGLGIVALCNNGTITPAGLVRKVAEEYLQPQMTAPALVATIMLPDAAQAGWAGTWWSPQTDEVVRLAWQDGALRQVGGGAVLVPVGPTLFRPLDLAHAWRFTAGAPAQLAIRDFWPTVRPFQRLDDPMPGAALLATFAGDYYSDETATRYTVTRTGGHLTLSWPRGYAIDLTPVGGDRFVASLGTVTFSRADTGAVNGIMISNRRLRRFTAPRVADR